MSDGLFLGCDERGRAALDRVLPRLPPDVRAFAVEQCAFASVGRDAPLLLLETSALAGRWLVVVDHTAAASTLTNLLALQVTRAHHAHFGGSEEDAASLRQALWSWGFRGRGIDVALD